MSAVFRYTYADGSSPAWTTAFDAALVGPEGWQSTGIVRFERVALADDPHAVVHFTPNVQLAKLYPHAGHITGRGMSLTEMNFRPPRVVHINADRWTHGPDSGVTGATLSAYRQYLANHEIGHAMGIDHLSSDGDATLCPCMSQQTVKLDKGCTFNPAPTKTDVQALKTCALTDWRFQTMSGGATKVQNMTDVHGLFKVGEVQAVVPNLSGGGSELLVVSGLGTVVVDGDSDTEDRYEGFGQVVRGGGKEKARIAPQLVSVPSPQDPSFTAPATGPRRVSFAGLDLKKVNLERLAEEEDIGSEDAEELGDDSSDSEEEEEEEEEEDDVTFLEADEKRFDWRAAVNSDAPDPIMAAAIVKLAAKKSGAAAAPEPEFDGAAACEAISGEVRGRSSPLLSEERAAKLMRQILDALDVDKREDKAALEGALNDSCIAKVTVSSDKPSTIIALLTDILNEGDLSDVEQRYTEATYDEDDEEPLIMAAQAQAMKALKFADMSEVMASEDNQRRFDAKVKAILKEGELQGAIQEVKLAEQLEDELGRTVYLRSIFGNRADSIRGKFEDWRKTADGKVAEGKVAELYRQLLAEDALVAQSFADSGNEAAIEDWVMTEAGQAARLAAIKKVGRTMGLELGRGENTSTDDDIAVASMDLDTREKISQSYEQVWATENTEAKLYADYEVERDGEILAFKAALVEMDASMGKSFKPVTFKFDSDRHKALIESDDGFDVRDVAAAFYIGDSSKVEQVATDPSETALAMVEVRPTVPRDAESRRTLAERDENGIQVLSSPLKPTDRVFNLVRILPKDDDQVKAWNSTLCMYGAEEILPYLLHYTVATSPLEPDNVYLVMQIAIPVVNLQWLMEAMPHEGEGSANVKNKALLTIIRAIYALYQVSGGVDHVKCSAVDVTDVDLADFMIDAKMQEPPFLVLPNGLAPVDGTVDDEATADALIEKGLQWADSLLGYDADATTRMRQRLQYWLFEAKDPRDLTAIRWGPKSVKVF